ncbi:hypothetical protein ECG_08662 [Echinococcus granulosus]|nr:hypothetical protein ECG_08662 [Echinococcus granulosus]
MATSSRVLLPCAQKTCPEVLSPLLSLILYLFSNTANLEEVASCLVTEETVTAATATPVVVPAISLNASRSRDNVGGHSRDIGSRSRKKQRREEEE